MFYSQDILQKRGGKFGIVWIAATKAGQLTKRDYSSVNIRRTCQDLVDYICVRVIPTEHHKSRPRLSLYLSAQLMYGVVQVFAKQNDYLSHEVTTFSQRISSYSSQATATIDLKHTGRLEAMIDLPESLFDFDPNFGLLKISSLEEPEVFLLEDMPYWRINGSPGSSPSLELPTSSPRPPLIPFRPEVGSPMTVPNKSITLVENDKELIHDMIPGDIDIPPLDELALQDLLNGDQGMESLTDEGQDIPARHMDTTPGLEETPHVPSLLLEEAPMTQHRVESPGVTPPQLPQAPPHKEMVNVSFELSPLPPSQIRRKRKRQLLFADAETTLTKNQIRHNLASGKELCMDLVDTLPIPKARRLQDLFNQPGRKDFRHSTILPMWKRNCRTRRQVQDREDNPWTVESPSDLEEDILLIQGEGHDVQPAEESGSAEILRHELSQSVKELSRTSSLFSPAHKMDSSSFIADGSARKRRRGSRASASGSEDELSLQEVEVPSTRTTDLELDVVLEEPGKEEELLSPDVPHFTSPQHDDVSVRRQSLLSQHEDVLQNIAKETAYKSYTNFKKICPLIYSRITAANMFMSVLELGKQKKISLRQEEAFGEILIGRGRAW